MDDNYPKINRIKYKKCIYNKNNIPPHKSPNNNLKNQQNIILISINESSINIKKMININGDVTKL